MVSNPKPEVKPLYSLITDPAARFPDRPCAYYNGRVLTYNDIDDQSSRFASALVSLGLKRGDRAAIFLPNTPQFVISCFGILKAGGVVVACNPLYKERELEHQLADSGAEFVIASRDTVEGSDLFQSVQGCRSRLRLKYIIATSVTDYLPAAKRRFARLAGVKNTMRPDTLDFVGLVRSHEPLESLLPVDPEADLAMLQYTGGTTGLAKGAMLTHFNVYSVTVHATAFLPLSDSDIFLAVLPLFHVYGLIANLMIPLYVGAQVLLLPRFHVEDVMKTVQNRKATVFCAVPAMYMAINGHKGVGSFDLRSVRICISGGSALPLATRKRFMENTGGSLVEGYGLSETSALTHCNPLYEGGYREGSVGIPFPETDVVIVDVEDPRKVLPLGSVGEVAVKGPQVMRGYWNNQAESESAFCDGWFLTGDIGRMDNDGYLYVIDRKKDMVNVGGFKVYPREVEEVLFEHQSIKEAGVVGMPDSFSGEVVKAYVVLKDPSMKLTEDEVVEFCSRRVAKYKVPKKVVFVPELPKTLIGKVLHRKLREPTSE